MGFRGGAEPAHRHRVSTQRTVLVTLLLVDLSEMVAHLCVLTKFPSGCHVLFRLIEIAFGEMDPAQRVPICNERGNEWELLLRETVQRNITQCRGRSRDRRFRILLRAIEMCFL